MGVNNSKLPKFMFDTAARRFKWGEFDCGLWLADWYCVATLQPDPAAHLRGKYIDENSCRSLFGAVPAARMIREIARSAHLKKTKDPFFGDVGVIEILQRPTDQVTGLPIENSPTKQIVCGAIRARRSWTVLMPSGLQRIPEEECRTVMAFVIEECDASCNIYSDRDCGGGGRDNVHSDRDCDSNRAIRIILPTVKRKSAAAGRAKAKHQAGDPST